MPFQIAKHPLVEVFGEQQEYTPPSNRVVRDSWRYPLLSQKKHGYHDELAPISNDRPWLSSKQRIKLQAREATLRKEASSVQNCNKAKIEGILDVALQQAKDANIRRKVA